MFEIEQEPEKVILVGVSLNDGDDTEESLEELKELVKTAGAVSLAEQRACQCCDLYRKRKN